MHNDFALLRQRIAAAGLFDRQPLYYTWNILFVTGLLFSAALIILAAEHLWIVLLAAVFCAFVYGQIGLLGHDAGHRQIFRSTWKDVMTSYACALCLGISAKWWIQKHNTHHTHPNRHDMDPDIDFPMLAFSQEQVQGKRGFFRFLVRYQSILFFPLLCLTSVSLRTGSIQFLLGKPLREVWLDLFFILLHFTLYVAVLFWLLPPLSALLFIIVHQLLWGLYMGSIFAPNHKGMPVLDKDAPMDFLREQALTARNIRSHPLINCWYGGLNFQIEHHLFPTMPRNNLPRAQRIVKQYCASLAIPYHETGFLQSYAEILTHLYHVAAPLR